MTTTMREGGVCITEGAERFMRRMVRFGGLPAGAGFRLVVGPGGCSGLQAAFSVERDPLPGDETVHVNGLRVFLPPDSAQRLAGVTVDFVDSATQQGLAFYDPRAPPSCADAARPAIVPISNVVRRRP